MDLLENMPNQDDPEDNHLMEVLQDVLTNGGKIPAETGSRLILGAVRENYRETKRAANTSRRNQLHLWVLSVVLTGAITVALAMRHTDLAIISEALGVTFPFP